MFSLSFKKKKKNDFFFFSFFFLEIQQEGIYFFPEWNEIRGKGIIVRVYLVTISLTRKDSTPFRLREDEKEGLDRAAGNCASRRAF